MKTIKILSLFLFATTAALADPPDTLWTRYQTTMGSDWPTTAITELANGDLAIASYTAEGLTRLDSAGNARWHRSFGLQCYGGHGLEPLEIFEQPDGDLMVIGNACNDDLDGPGIGFIRTSADGDSLGAGIYLRHEFAVMTSWVQAVAALTNGTYLVAGSHYRFNSGWQGYRLLAGLDQDGELLWLDTLRVNSFVNWYAVYPREDGGFLALAHLDNADSLELVKFNPSRDIAWTRRFATSFLPTRASIIRNSRGEYLIYAIDEHFGSGARGFRIDGDGNLLGNWSSYLGEVRSVPAGGFVGTFRTFLRRFNDEGWPQWERDYAWDTTFSDQDISGLAVLRDGSYCIAGTTYRFGGESGQYLIRTLPDTTLITAADEPRTPLPQTLSLSAYPNPFNATTTLQFTLPQTAAVELHLYDVTGRAVYSWNSLALAAGAHEVRIAGADLSTGVYFARLQAGELQATQKLLLLK